MMRMEEANERRQRRLHAHAVGYGVAD